MRIKCAAAVNLLAVLLLGCARQTQPAPAAETARTRPAPMHAPDILHKMPPTWTPFPTATAPVFLSPTPNFSPTGPSNLPLIFSRFLKGMESAVPDGIPILAQSWALPASGPYINVLAVPVQQSGGMNLVIAGQPKGKDGLWDGKTQQLLWNWKALGRNPAVWQEIRPLDGPQGVPAGGFIGQDEHGQWSAVLFDTRDKQEYIYLTRIPVQGAEAALLGQIPLHENQSRLVILKDQSRVRFYQIDGNRAEQVWSGDDMPSKQVWLTYHPGSDLNGDGLPELLVTWESANGRVSQIFRVAGKSVHWIGEVQDKQTYLEIDWTSPREFLLADPNKDSQSWRVYRWSGERYEWASPLELPLAPTPVLLKDLANLPPLPANLYLQSGGAWWVWPKTGGKLAQYTGEPPALPGCAGGQEEVMPESALTHEGCRSPGGRYEIISLPANKAEKEAILDHETGSLIALPDTAGSLLGQRAYAWSADGKSLLAARASESGVLYLIDPTNGRRTALLEHRLCSPSRFDSCPQASPGMGITDPVFMNDGRYGFTVQSTIPGRYPPPGIYHLKPGGQPLLLADLPTYDPGCIVARDGLNFGQALWSPGGLAFVFSGPKNCPGLVLVGLSDGNGLWDLSMLLPGVEAFRWEHR